MAAYFGRAPQKFDVRRLHDYRRATAEQPSQRLQVFAVFLDFVTPTVDANSTPTGLSRLQTFNVFEVPADNQFIRLPRNQFLEVLRPKGKSLPQQMDAFKQRGLAATVGAVHHRNPWAELQF